MAYTPNNPLVPGDPYMYDSRWIISKLKEAIKLYAPLAKDFEDLKKYVDTYFEDLDVEQQIKDAIQEMIDDGTLSQMIQDAFDELDVRVSRLEDLTCSDFFFNYTKVGEVAQSNGAPVLCCYNPVAQCVTYLSQTDNNSSYIGFLAADNITPATSASMAFTHANDIDFCNALNVLLAVDIANNSPVIYTINPATLIQIGSFTVNGWTGGYVSALACDNVNNKIYLFGESADHLKYHAAEIDTSGDVITQFDIILPVSYGASQGGVFIGKTFNVMYTPTGNYNDDGLIFYEIDFEAQTVKCSKRFNIKGESESATLIDGNLCIYGFTPAEGSNVPYAECSVLSRAPRAVESSILYVDETVSTCGDGTSTDPFNNLNSALYTIINSPVKAKYTVRFESNISKYTNSLENYTPVDIAINMNNKTWEPSSTFVFPNDSNIYIYSGTITTTSKSIDFQRSNVTLRDLTINRNTNNVSMRFYSCRGQFFGLHFNLNTVETTYGALFITEGSTITMQGYLDSTADAGNHVALVEVGVLINTRAITGLTTPIGTWTGGIVLGV